MLPKHIQGDAENELLDPDTSGQWHWTKYRDLPLNFHPTAIELRRFLIRQMARWEQPAEARSFHLA